MKTIGHIGIVGGGAIGSALGAVFKRSGKTVSYFDKDPSRSSVESLKVLVDSSDIIILALPSAANGQLAADIAKHSHAGRPGLVLSVAKGVAKGFKRVDEILGTRSHSKFDTGLIYGPMLAAEIKEDKSAYAVVAVSDRRWFNCLDFARPQLQLEYSTDVKSVALCGILKNIYALALGLYDGHGLGFNAKSALTTKIAAEMKAILSRLGADPRMAEGHAGMGDLLTTGWSGKSYNHGMGKAIAAGELDPARAKGEGINSLREIKHILDISRYPILKALHEVAHGGRKSADLHESINS